MNQLSTGASGRPSGVCSTIAIRGSDRLQAQLPMVQALCAVACKWQSLAVNANEYRNLRFSDKVTCADPGPPNSPGEFPSLLNGPVHGEFPLTI